MPSLSCGSHLLGTVAEQDRALAQRSCAALQQGLDLRRVLVAQLATLRLHPPAVPASHCPQVTCRMKDRLKASPRAA